MRASMMKLLIAVLLAGHTFPAKAATPSELEAKSLECAAIFWILSASPNAAYSQAMTPWVMVASTLSGILAKEQGRSATVGAVNVARESRALALGEIWDRNPQAVVAIATECDEWFRAFLPTIQQMPNDEASFRTFALRLPLRASTRSSVDRIKLFEGLLDGAMRNWTLLGRKTKTYMLEQLRRDLRN
jgi:hypothetical protein